MDPRGPQDISVIAWAIVFVLSAWGGTVEFVQKFNRRKTDKFSLLELIGGIATSTFTGVIVFLLCEHFEIDRILSAAASGLAGHLGTKILQRIELYAVNKYLGPERKERDIKDKEI